MSTFFSHVDVVKNQYFWIFLVFFASLFCSFLSINVFKKLQVYSILIRIVMILLFLIGSSYISIKNKRFTFDFTYDYCKNKINCKDEIYHFTFFKFTHITDLISNLLSTICVITFNLVLMFYSWSHVTMLELKNWNQNHKNCLWCDLIDFDVYFFIWSHGF